MKHTNSWQSSRLLCNHALIRWINNSFGCPLPLLKLHLKKNTKIVFELYISSAAWEKKIKWTSINHLLTSPATWIALKSVILHSVLWWCDHTWIRPSERETSRVPFDTFNGLLSSESMQVEIRVFSQLHSEERIVSKIFLCGRMKNFLSEIIKKYSIKNLLNHFWMKFEWDSA